MIKPRLVLILICFFLVVIILLFISLFIKNGYDRKNITECLALSILPTQRAESICFDVTLQNTSLVPLGVEFPNGRFDGVFVFRSPDGQVVEAIDAEVYKYRVSGLVSPRHQTISPGGKIQWQINSDNLHILTKNIINLDKNLILYAELNDLSVTPTCCPRLFIPVSLHSTQLDITSAFLSEVLNKSSK